MQSTYENNNIQSLFTDKENHLLSAWENIQYWFEELGIHKTEGEIK